ncbi:hypothetical protein JHK87_000260 [Glycine soja]|nr:hypothetical protein JHK87_000260 [Glycine soja]
MRNFSKMVYAKKEGIKAANERGSCSKIGWKMVLWVSGMGVQHGGAQGFNKTYLIWSFNEECLQEFDKYKQPPENKR